MERRRFGLGGGSDSAVATILAIWVSAHHNTNGPLVTGGISSGVAMSFHLEITNGSAIHDDLSCYPVVLLATLVILVVDSIVRVGIPFLFRGLSVMPTPRLAR
jgi:hypothetical protein